MFKENMVSIIDRSFEMLDMSKCIRRGWQRLEGFSL